MFGFFQFQCHQTALNSYTSTCVPVGLLGIYTAIPNMSSAQLHTLRYISHATIHRTWGWSMQLNFNLY